MSHSQAAFAGPTAVITHPMRAGVLCLLFAGAILTLSLATDLTIYAIVLAMFLSFAAPMWYEALNKRLDYFAPIHLFLLIAFLYFGMASIWVVNDPKNNAYDLFIVPHIPRAALYCLIGMLATVAGYYIPWTRRTSYPKAYAIRGPVFVLLVSLIGSAGFAAAGLQERSMAYNSRVSPVVATVAQFQPFFIFAWALGWYLFFTGKSSLAQKLALFGVLVPGAVMTASATFSDKSILMVLIGIPIIARWYARRRVPWTILLVLVLILIFVVFPFYNTYRWASDPTAGQSQRIQQTYRTISTWDSDTYLLFSLKNFTRRMALVNSVAVVLRDVPRWVPFSNGGTILEPTVNSFIPRILWKDKPIYLPGRVFGQTFRVTNTLTRDTHIAVTIPGELYWNFGFPGIIAGMFALGWILRWVYRRYAEGLSNDPVRLALYITLLVQVGHLHGSLSGDFTVAMRTVVMMEVVILLARHFKMLHVDSEPASRNAESGS